MENTKNKFVVPWALLMTFILLVIKIMWVPALSWWLVLLPVIIVVGVVVLLVAFIVIAALIAVWLDK